MNSLTGKMMKATRDTSIALREKELYEEANDARMLDNLINSIYHGRTDRF